MNPDVPRLDPDLMVIDITSGVLQAKLHRERFICPGINRECIEYDGHFITPKTFYVIAEKGSLKDWKNAIRINGKKIRRYLDVGALDFYNHAELCTGRCKSKMGNKTSNASFTMPDTFNPPGSTPNPPASKMPKIMMFENDHYSSNESLNLVKDIDAFGDIQDVKPDVEKLRLLNVMNLQQTTSMAIPMSNIAIPTMSGDQVMPMQLVSLNQNLQQDDDEDAMFWRAIVQLGLIDEFFREVKSKLDVLKASMIKNFVPVGDAKKASRIVNELGMRSKLDMRLCAHKFEFDRQRDKLEKEMEQLKRKVSEYEQKQEILKQKSNTYDQLMTKKIKLEDMSNSESSSNSQILVTVNGNHSPSPSSARGSPNLEETETQRKAKRARIEGISQELTQFAVQTASGEGDHSLDGESLSESPLASQETVDSVTTVTASQESVTVTASQDSSTSESAASTASSSLS